MTVKGPDGNFHEASLVPDHSANRYGQMDLIVDGKALSHFEAAGLELVQATDEERADLARPGYSFRE